MTTIEVSGFTTYEAIGETWASLAAVVKNNTDKDLFFVEVTYNILGADGAPVATESSFIDVIPAGDSMPTIGSSTSDLTSAMPVTVEVTAFVEEESFFESEWAELEVTAEPVIAVGEFGSASVSGTVVNSTDAPTDFYSISCLVTGPDGNILGGFQTFPDTAAPGQTVAWETSGSGDFEAWAAAGATVGGCRAIVTID